MKVKYWINIKNVIKIVFTFLIIIILAGCQKVINVDLNEAAPLIVIEGVITDGNGPYKITLSKSGSYFNQPELPPVSDAQVTITDNTGIVDSLREVSSGIYLTSKTRGVPGRTYTLKVIAEGSEYSGTSTMMSHVKIDSLKLVKDAGGHFGFGNQQDRVNTELHCFFKDPSEKNFYRIRVFENDTARAENFRLYDDQYTNGKVTDLRVARANPGHTYRIELFSLDKSTFGYYRTLADLIHSNPIFGSTPANPNTNLSNGALGYFGASAVSYFNITITESLLKTAK
jgi:hypothetical protein